MRQDTKKINFFVTARIPKKIVFSRIIMWRILSADAPQNTIILWRIAIGVRHRIAEDPLTCGPSLAHLLHSFLSTTRALPSASTAATTPSPSPAALPLALLRPLDHRRRPPPRPSSPSFPVSPPRPERVPSPSAARPPPRREHFRRPGPGAHAAVPRCPPLSLLSLLAHLASPSACFLLHRRLASLASTIDACMQGVCANVLVAKSLKQIIFMHWNYPKHCSRFKLVKNA